MRIAAAAAGGTAVGLGQADQIVIWDTVAGTEQRLPGPGRSLISGRRLAVVETLIDEQVDAVCAVPEGFCSTSYALACTAGLQFVAIEAGTPLRLIADHVEAFAAAVRPDIPTAWLAAPARASAASTLAAADVPLDDAAVHALLNRLRRIEGQARGVQRLVEERRSYDQILTQIAAMRSALNAISVALLAENLAACLAAADQPDGHLRIDAAKRAFSLLA